MLAAGEIRWSLKYLRSSLKVLSCHMSSNFKVDKQLVSKLRKETGSPFSKCHSALAACNNDFAKALVWLEEQAQKEGWKKVQKVKGRQTSQGLIGAAVQGNIAAMVEVNCETDFVSRNELFKTLTMQIARGALQFKQRVVKQNSLVNSFEAKDVAHLREIIPPHDLEIVTVDNQPIKESIVSTISQLGENIILNRAVTISTSNTNKIGVYAHGNTSGCIDGIHFGKYVGMIVLSGNEQNDMSTLAKGLAQHIVGMRPQFIDKEADDKEAELALLNQEYLLDSDIIVRNLLERLNTSVVDFVRYQCGE